MSASPFRLITDDPSNGAVIERINRGLAKLPMDAQDKLLDDLLRRVVELGA